MYKVILEFTTTESAKDITDFLLDIQKSNMLNSLDNEEGIMITIDEHIEGRYESA